MNSAADPVQQLTGSTSTRVGTGGPLAGVVIADLSRVLAGPYCTMLLADLGALVIKVESPRGDETRSWRPPVRGEDSTYYLAANRGKYSIALDFKDPDQLAVVKDIVARADVLVENFKPGGLIPYGLDYETIRASRPDIVYGSITGFGSKGGADLPGYDMLAQALSGLMDLTGEPGQQPTKVGVAVVDVMAGLHLALGILAALHGRSTTGRGDHVEVDLLSSALSGLVNQTSAYVAGGVVPHRMGNEHPSIFPYGPFPARDAELVIAVGNDQQFARLCECLGAPELATDHRFAAAARRNVNRAELRPLLEKLLQTRDATDWFPRIQAAGVPVAPILDVAQGVGFASQLGLEPVAVTGSGVEAIPTVRHPITYTNATIGYDQPPPRLDGDRDRVLGWLRSTSPVAQWIGDDSSTTGCTPGSSTSAK